MRALVAALLLARAAAASDCSTPLAFQPIPDLHVHVAFPVDHTARLNRYCSTWSFRKVTAPPEFDLDGAGGLFYWTPAVTGIERITIEATEGNQTARATFNAYVGDGLVDVAVGITDPSYGGIVAIWNMAGANHDEHHAWPMLGHDVRHTGFYTPPAPDRPVNLSLAAGNVLAWEDRSAVEDAYLVEHSATAAAGTYQTVATLAPDSTSWTAPGGGYYRVRAARAGVPSRPSNAVSVP